MHPRALTSAPLRQLPGHSVLNWLARRCDSQWQKAGAQRAPLWADHINYAKQQLNRGWGGGRGGCFVSLSNNRRAGGVHRSQPAVSRHDPTRRSDLHLKTRLEGRNITMNDCCGTFQLVP